MKKTLITFLLFLPVFALAADLDPRPDMHLLARELTLMQKYLLTEAAFNSPDNAGAIRGSMQNVESHLAHLAKGGFKDPAMKTNLGLLQQHMADAHRSFDQDAKPFARYMLQSALQMCISCHTRMKTADFSWPDEEVKNATPAEQGSFYFATRQFEKGRAAFESVVATYPALNVSRTALREALLSLAIYYARVKENPEAGRAYFARLAKRTDLPAYMAEEIKGWTLEFHNWTKEKEANKAAQAKTASGLLAQARKLFKHDDFSLGAGLEGKFHVRRLRAAAFLHKVLEAPDASTAEKGEAIFYLGHIYHRLATNFFFRFGEMYFKACIMEYPKTARARSCYAALEEAVTEGFTGSAGIDLPEEESAELLRLKRLAY